MKKFKKLVGLLALSGLLVSLTACSSSGKKEAQLQNDPSSLEQIKKNGKIKIAVFGDLTPYGYIDKDGKNQGYDIYLAKRIAKDLLGSEQKVEFVIVNAEERVDALKSNKVDLVLANFTKTAERAKVIDFANPYMKVAVGVVSPKDKLITKANQLNGKQLIVNKGTTAELYFSKEFPNVQLEKFENKTQQFAALTDGRAAALADDNSYLYAWVKQNPKFEVGIKEAGEVSTINPGVKKGNKSLLDWVNKELETLGREKFFAKDYEATLAPFFGDGIKADDIVLEGKE